jgi:N-acetylgalactosamine PTS system EIIA component
MTSEAPIALVVGHGDFAAGLVSALEQITGRGELFIAFSNRDLGADDLERAIRECVESTGAKVIFTDLPAGSAAIASRKVLRGNPALVLIGGANLATLLDFVSQRGATVHEAALRAADRGRASIAVVEGTGAG